MRRKSSPSLEASGSPPGAETLDLESFLPYRLNVLASEVSIGLSRIYAARYGIAIPEWRVVATLGQFPAMTARDIGRHAAMHKTKVSRAVATLIERGLVMRKSDRVDRRAAHLSLTAAGRRLYGELVPQARAYETELLRALDLEEHRDLDRLLRRLNQHAASMRDASRPPHPDEADA